VKLLQKELRKLQLYNKLLDEIIGIANRENGTDWKKKYGTKQSSALGKAKAEAN